MATNTLNLTDMTEDGDIKVAHIEIKDEPIFHDHDGLEMNNIVPFMNSDDIHFESESFEDSIKTEMTSPLMDNGGALYTPTFADCDDALDILSKVNGSGLSYDNDIKQESDTCDSYDHKYLISGDNIQIDNDSVNHFDIPVDKIIKFEPSDVSSCIKSEDITAMKNYYVENDDCDQSNQSLQFQVKAFPCKKCVEWFDSKEDLKVHQRIHKDKPYKCEECQKRFGHLGNFRSHVESHKKSLLICDQCGKAFDNKSGFNKHVLIHSNARPHGCKYCGKRFTQLATLKVHWMTHTGERPYSCTQCGKKFRTHHTRKRHEKLHTGDKPHKCEQCGKCFVQRYNFQVHQRTHSGEKPFSCQQCGQSYKEPIGLIEHKRIHTGEKPFKCSECGKSFHRRGYLVIHQKIHSGTRDYNCRFCGKNFIRTCDLTRHEKTHLKEKTHSCDLCGKAFCRSDYLKMHRTKCVAARASNGSIDQDNKDKQTHKATFTTAPGGISTPLVLVNNIGSVVNGVNGLINCKKISGGLANGSSLVSIGEGTLFGIQTLNQVSMVKLNGTGLILQNAVLLTTAGSATTSVGTTSTAGSGGGRRANVKCTEDVVIG